MAAELFKPFVIRKLIERGIVKTVKSAKKMDDKKTPVIWEILENILKGHPVLLNRAPTLHRLSIQAFQPKLVEGKAIQLHPLVCGAFNADFDGDQMAVHLPLSAEAQAEARILMLSSNNILTPSDGRPVTMPSQDMVIGLFHLTSEVAEGAGNGRAFSSLAEAIMAVDLGELDMRTPVQIRFTELVPPLNWTAPEDWEEGQPLTLTTTVGRAMFNDALPVDYPFVKEAVDMGRLSRIVNYLAERYPKVEVAASLDALKETGFYWAIRSGVTIAISDVVPPESKGEILERFEERAQKVQREYDLGRRSEEERRTELIDIWTQATNEVDEAMRANLSEDNHIFRMVMSGARGNWHQVRQVAGMRGLVADPKGQIIPRPIKSNYREGLSVLEYLIDTLGARKGLAETDLRIADYDYLTHR